MNNNKNFKTGLIEGFYGKPWSWKNRFDTVDFLGEIKLNTYIYAPKSDRKLREEWDLNWSDDEIKELKAFKKRCKKRAVDFGIGLSPYELYLNWNSRGKEGLKRKIEDINRLETDTLWILFDDMKGNRDEMADIQVEITHFIKSLTSAKNLAMCPTYYSYDPVLKALFGDMPKNYLNRIGSTLDSDIDIIWTGPEVCSKEITKNHLLEVTEIIKRKPLLWDNYPVNDSPRLTPFLFLNGFRNRTREIGELTSGHIVNPMVQPYLSQIPLSTLFDLYSDDNYNSFASCEKNGKRILGREFWNLLKEDIEDFEIRGIGAGKNPEVLNTWREAIEGATYFNNLSDSEKSKLVDDRVKFDKKISKALDSSEIDLLIKKYSSFNNRYSKEIISWLKGEYSFDPEILLK